MRISDWSSDVCSSDLGLPWAALRMQRAISALAVATGARAIAGSERPNAKVKMAAAAPNRKLCGTRPLICDLTASAVRGNRNMFIDHVLAVGNAVRSAEHTSELQSLMRISYAVF